MLPYSNKTHTIQNRDCVGHPAGHSAAKVARCRYSNDLANGGTLLAYGATKGIPFQQRTGLPASSEPQDPELLRPSTLHAGNRGEGYVHASAESGRIVAANALIDREKQS